MRRRDLFGKRVLGYWSWQGKRRFQHLPRILHAMRHSMAQLQPDHCLVSGDLTNLGLHHEYEVALEWLQQLGPSDRVTVIPGNHDAYAGKRWRRSLRLWHDYMASDDGRCQFPTLRRRGMVALIGLSSARPSMPFMATGQLGPRQLAALDALLEHTGREGLFRLVQVHHPLHADCVVHRKRLIDAEELRVVLERRGAELVVHGHAHRPLQRQLHDQHGVSIPVIGVASASLMSASAERLAQFHQFDICGEPKHWQVVMRVHRYTPSSDHFETDGVEHSLRVPDTASAPTIMPERSTGRG